MIGFIYTYIIYINGENQSLTLTHTYGCLVFKKSRIRETLNLSTDADSSTNIQKIYKFSEKTLC